MIRTSSNRLSNFWLTATMGFLAIVGCVVVITSLIKPPIQTLEGSNASKRARAELEEKEDTDAEEEVDEEHIYVKEVDEEDICVKEVDGEEKHQVALLHHSQTQSNVKSGQIVNQTSCESRHHNNLEVSTSKSHTGIDGNNDKAVVLEFESMNVEVNVDSDDDYGDIIDDEKILNPTISRPLDQSYATYYLRPGLYVRNELDFDIMLILSLKIPRYCVKVVAGDTVHMYCDLSNYWMTVCPYDPELYFSASDVAWAISHITMFTVQTTLGYVGEALKKWQNFAQTVKENVPEEKRKELLAVAKANASKYIGDKNCKKVRSAANRLPSSIQQAQKYTEKLDKKLTDFESRTGNSPTSTSPTSTDSNILLENAGKSYQKAISKIPTCFLCQEWHRANGALAVVKMVKETSQITIHMRRDNWWERL